MISRTCERNAVFAWLRAASVVLISAGRDETALIILIRHNFEDVLISFRAVTEYIIR
jgi:hypothetical protein